MKRSSKEVDADFFVFLSLVSCHLGSLTIVSLLHILPPPHSWPAQCGRAARADDEQGENIRSGKQTHTHTRSQDIFRTGEMCSSLPKRDERRREGNNEKTVEDTHPVKCHCVLLPYDCFLHCCTLQNTTRNTSLVGL